MPAGMAGRAYESGRGEHSIDGIKEWSEEHERNELAPAQLGAVVAVDTAQMPVLQLGEVQSGGVAAV